MFHHVVLLRLKPETTAAERSAILDGLADLPAAIPQITSYSFGTDEGLAPDNWDIGIVAAFNDQGSYEIYRDHPAHHRLIAASIKPVLDARAATQFASSPTVG